jgi:hypothetical protein
MQLESLATVCAFWTERTVGSAFTSSAVRIYLTTTKTSNPNRFLVNAMKKQKVREVRQRWAAKGNPPCDHPDLDELAQTGDYVCTACGKIGERAWADERQKKNRGAAFSNRTMTLEGKRSSTSEPSFSNQSDM